MAAELAESICAFWQARGVFQVTKSLFGSPIENHLRGKANSQGRRCINLCQSDCFLAYQLF